MKLVVVLGVLGSLLVLACGSPDDDKPATTPPGTSPAGADAGPPRCSADLAPPEVRAVSCSVTLGTPGFQQPASQHVPPNTAINYCSNPPTSGPHYAVWAEFKDYETEVPWPYLVHSEEHGGVVLLYKCDTPCPEIVDALKAVRDRAAADPACEQQGRAGQKRIIITPSSTIPTKVAAAAWGATYTGDCVDGPTLDEFVAKKGQNGPENLCFAGQSVFQ
ncbi:MAG: DUF3105 domain-containing protein [Labilithrix sp.]